MNNIGSIHICLAHLDLPVVVWQQGQMLLTFDDIEALRGHGVNKFCIDFENTGQVRDTIKLLEKLLEMDEKECKFEDGIHQTAWWMLMVTLY